MVNRNEYLGQIKLYERFVEIASPEQITLVNKHIEYCIPLLDLYYKAFPTYTLHNIKHQQNVLHLIGELLGEKLNELSSLEAAIIILSVVYHDLGMVFSDNELKNIENEPAFQIFLRENYKAKLKYQENDLVLDKDLAEWYCRWMHAKRVWIFLKDYDNIKWDKFALNKPLGSICESHNYNANKLEDDDEFETNYLGVADIKFCAVLLRLGDILDFDNSRTPQSVYEFLDLKNPKNSNEEISKEEWQKHLCSDGFKIERNEDAIELNYSAAPSHPQIEKNIQTFLDIIEDELKRCSVIVNKCSKRWRNFKLPLYIGRANIKSQNYKKGDYRLSLDEHQIIRLLTGENLYDTEFVFIRELLQNAIDTSRMREYRELSDGNKGYKASAIEITTWIDSNGYRWVRMDDYGMGINEYTVTNHLLKKGNSYYNSDYFKIQKGYFKDKMNKDFTPISRFGIGLLSCFVLGDAVQINSRAIAIPQTNSEEEKIRLSIQDLQSQYYLQTEKDKHEPLEMPSKDGGEKNYRTDYGTSIAIKIQRSKDNLFFEENLKRMINSYVICSPIDIYFMKEKVGVNFNQVLFYPLANKEFFPFSNKEKSAIEEVIDKQINSEIGIEVYPIDVTKESSSDDLKGQVVFLKLKCDDFKERGFMNNWEYEFHFEEKKKFVKFFKKYLNIETNKEQVKEVSISFEELFEKVFDLEIFNRLFLLKTKDFSFYKRGLQLIHNGINVPNYSSSERFNRSDTKLGFTENLFSYESYFSHLRPFHACFGVVYFQDNLIPELSVARNEIKSLKFTIYSHLFFATRQLNEIIPNNLHVYNYLINVNEIFSFDEIKKDELIINKIWNDEKLLMTETGLASINEIKETIKNNTVKILVNFEDRFISSLVRGLVQINYNTELFIEGNGKSYLILKSTRKDVIQNKSVDKFYPLLFISFNTSKILAHQRCINETHFLAKWILTNQDYLIENFDGYFTSLIRFILNSDFNGINEVIEHFSKVLPQVIKPFFKKISKDDFFSAPVGGSL